MGTTRHERIDYALARQRLDALFEKAEAAYRDLHPPAVDPAVQVVADILIVSATQSFREVLLGCGLARLADRAINIRRPYVSQGPDAFNGRTLDEKVVNPFLGERFIPSTKGPYLAVFRRNVEFVPETGRGLRDTRAWQAFLDYVSALDQAQTDEEVGVLLTYLLYRFVELREVASVTLSRIARLNLDQHERLIDGLLQTPSGGLLPVLLTVAMFKTFKECYGLDWHIDWQGINVADKASRAGGDVTILHDGRVILAVEVTERPIDRSRVVSTFNTKIAPGGIEDYVFLAAGPSPGSEARATAMQYFAQGHDLSFLHVKPWLINNLGTIGSRCRSAFTAEFLMLLDSREVPGTLKVRWNDLVKSLLV